MGFVLVVGPSGAGKDTLIRLARAELAGQSRYVFPRRLVTRPPSADEDNETIGEDDFAQFQADRLFALSWRAHGLGYAVPAEAGRLAREGHVVVCNVSRRVVEEARVRFAGTLVVEVTAPNEILAQRLATRSRTQDGDLSARLARFAPVIADFTIQNVGSPEVSSASLIDYLRQN